MIPKLLRQGWTTTLALIILSVGRCEQTKALQLQVQTGHAAGVIAVEFSPDCRILASAGVDETVRLWDINEGRELRSFTLAGYPVETIAFDSRSQRLVAGDAAGFVCLWDLQSCRRIAIRRVSESGVISLAFRPQHGDLVVGTDDGSVSVWESSMLRPKAKLAGHGGTVSTLAFAHDGKTLAVGGHDGSIQLYDTLSWKMGPVVVPAHGSAIAAIAFANTGPRFAYATEDGSIGVCNPFKPTERSVAFSISGDPIALALGTDTLAVGDNDGKVSYFDLHQQRLSTTASVLGPSTCMALATANGLVASGDDKGLIQITSLWTAHALHRYHGTTNQVTTVAIDSKTSLIASGNLGADVKLWHLQGGRQMSNLPCPDGYTSSVSFDGEDSLLWCGCGRTVTSWPMVEVRTTPPAISQNYTVSCIASYHHRVAIGTQGGEIALWIAGDGIRALLQQPLTISSIAFANGGNTLVTSSWDGSVKLWDLTRDDATEVLISHSSPANCVATCSDGATLAASFDGYGVEVWNYRNRTLQYGFPGNGPLAFSHNGSILASTANDGSISIRRQSDGRLLRKVEGHQVPISSLVFSSDDQFLVTGSYDGTTRIWRVGRG